MGPQATCISLWAQNPIPLRLHANSVYCFRCWKRHSCQCFRWMVNIYYNHSRNNHPSSYYSSTCTSCEHSQREHSCASHNHASHDCPRDHCRPTDKRSDYQCCRCSSQSYKRCRKVRTQNLLCTPVMFAHTCSGLFDPIVKLSVLKLVPDILNHPRWHHDWL